MSVSIGLSKKIETHWMARSQVKYESKRRITPTPSKMVKYLANTNRRFAEWIQDCGERDDFLATPRFMACAMVAEEDLDIVFDGPPAEEFDADGMGSITLVSLDEEEGTYL